MIAYILLLFMLSATAQEDPNAPAQFRADRPVEAVEAPAATPAQPVSIAQEDPDIAQVAAKVLDLPVEYVRDIRAGLDLLYNGRYTQTRAHFHALEKRSTIKGLAPTIDVMVFQAMMLENFDLRYASQYEASSKAAKNALDQALKTKNNLGWTHFLKGGVMGVDSIHTIRKERYLGALNRAFDAMHHIAAAKALVPDFVDIALADGLYNFWRTVITRSSSMLPDFGDRRAEGIAQMARVENEGFFMRAPAALSLAFAHIRNGKSSLALAACERNQARYPNSVVNAMMIGHIQFKRENYDQAMASYNRVLELSPANNRVHYHRGRVQQRQKHYDQARASFYRYLASDHIEPWQRSEAHRRIGQTYYAQKNYDQAEANYRAAVNAYKSDSAKKSLENLQKAKKEGNIP